MNPAWALRSRRRRCFGGRRRRTAGTPPARSTRRTVRTETRSGGCSSASFSVKCASLKSRYFVRRRRRIRFRTAARSLFTGTCPALPCCSPERPARSTARRMRRTWRTESRSTRAASCSVSFPAPNRATASHRFHCHSAISSIPLHDREGGHDRWPLEGGQNRCPSTPRPDALDGASLAGLRYACGCGSGGSRYLILPRTRPFRLVPGVAALRLPTGNSKNIEHILDRAEPRLPHPCHLDLVRFFAACVRYPVR